MLEYADLSIAQKNELLNHSANLLKSVTQIWGAEQGMILWDKIAEGLGQDLKAELFFGFVSGKHYGDVVLKQVNVLNAVPIIKSIRFATGFGLKEAKDVYDEVKFGKITTIPVPLDRRAQLVSELLYHGCIAE